MSSHSPQKQRDWFQFWLHFFCGAVVGAVIGLSTFSNLLFCSIPALVVALLGGIYGDAFWRQFFGS